MSTRENCCATWPKPCSYHEGWEDATDALTERAEKAERETAKLRAILADVERGQCDLSALMLLAERAIGAERELAEARERLGDAACLLEACHGELGYEQLQRLGERVSAFLLRHHETT